jgi:hypothetical protein
MANAAREIFSGKTFSCLNSSAGLRIQSFIAQVVSSVLKVVKTMKTIAYLDTNVMPHCRPLEELDWPTFLAAEETELVVTSIVTDELDLQKDQNPHLRLKRRARSVIKKLNAVWTNAQSVRISPHVLLTYSFVDSRILCEKHHLDPLSKDNHLLAVILEHKNRYQADNVFFVTRDESIQLKAKRFDIATLSPTKDMELEEEPDAVEKENERLKQELARTQNRIPKIVFGFEDGSNYQNIELEEELNLTDDAIQNYLTDIKKQYPKIIFPEKKTVTSSAPFSLRDFERISSMVVTLAGEEIVEIQGKKIPVTEKAVLEYNKQLEQFYEKSLEFLKAGIQYQHKERRIFSLKFALKNEGTTPGISVKVTIAFPPGFIVQDKWPLGKCPQRPKAPEPPERKSFDLLSPTSWIHQPYIDLATRIRPIVTDPAEPTIEREDDHAEVIFVVPKLRHVDKPQQLGPVWVTFAGEICSFKLQYRINADNIPGKYEDVLHIVIKEKEPV